MTDLLPVAEAQRRLLESVSLLGVENCHLAESFGRILGEEIVAAVDVPSFDNSAMDGFALRAVDTQSADEFVMLRVVGTVQAGVAELPAVMEDQAVRIMTGAPIPPGADTVVPFEETTVHDDTVRLPSGRPRGACIRPAGLDIKAGEALLTPGTRLGPAQIALIASVGTARVSVFRRPRVAILATGDELVDIGQTLGPGQIFNSNAYGLRASAEAVGAETMMLEPARDDPVALKETLTQLERIDLLLTSGGVSVGDFDYVKDVVSELGTVDFWRVSMRPGKPLMFGRIGRRDGSDILAIGLPGNPTSSMVTFHVFVKPVLLAMMGVPHPVPEPLGGRTLDRLDNRGGRETYFRVVVDSDGGDLTARLAGGQDSSMLRPLARANAFARVPAETEVVEAGQPVDLFLFN